MADLTQQLSEVVEGHRVRGPDYFILKVHVPAIYQHKEAPRQLSPVWLVLSHVFSNPHRFPTLAALAERGKLPLFLHACLMYNKMAERCLLCIKLRAILSSSPLLQPFNRCIKEISGHHPGCPQIALLQQPDPLP
jgi:hypothetical protein